MLIFGFIIVIVGGILFFAGTMAIGRNEKKYEQNRNRGQIYNVSKVESEDGSIDNNYDDDFEENSDEDFFVLMRSGVSLIRVAGIILVFVGGIIMLFMKI